MRTGQPLFKNIPCPRCKKKNYIDVDYVQGHFTCTFCGACPINPYSKVDFTQEVKQDEAPISQAELDFLAYLIEEGKL